MRLYGSILRFGGKNYEMRSLWRHSYRSRSFLYYRMHIIEHVPAKECLQCGERLYSPETVEKIQKAIWQNQKPDRFVETPVIEYTSIG